jgi:hypothetical protein
MADQLEGIVQKLMDEGATDDDIKAVVQEYQGQQASKALNLSNYVGDGTPKDFKLPAQTYNAPAAPQPAPNRNTPAAFEEDLNALLLSKGGLERSPAARQMRRNMMEGAMGGGLSTAAPVALGVKAAQFAPPLQAALKAGGERLYGGLLKAKDATIQGFPNVVQDLLAARAPITQGGRQKVINVMKRLGGEKEALLTAADERAMVPRETLRRGLDTSLDTAMARSPRPVKDLSTLAKIERELIPDAPGIVPSHADRIKSTLQREADRGLRAAKMGTKVTDVVANAKMNVANEAKQALEAIEPKLGPINAQYGAMKGGAQALRDAVKRTDKHNLIGMSDFIGGGLGTGLGGFGAGTAAGVATMRALQHPATGSRIAIGLNEASRLPFDQTAKAALLSLLNQRSQSPDEEQE